jgi:antitoxin VapB
LRCVQRRSVANMQFTPVRTIHLEHLDASDITPFWYDYTMALNIKDRETEQLAADVASLAGESKTAAIRQALRERRQRLLLARGGRGRGDRMVDVLEASLWPKLPAGVRGTGDHPPALQANDAVAPASMAGSQGTIAK